MDTKLTLKLDQGIIAKAKKYASKNNSSLSRLIENYLDSLTNEQKDDFEISPFVKSISNGNSIPTDIDDKKLREEYIDYLEKKYR